MFYILPFGLFPSVPLPCSCLQPADGRVKDKHPLFATVDDPISGTFSTTPFSLEPNDKDEVAAADLVAHVHSNGTATGIVATSPTVPLSAGGGTVGGGAEGAGRPRDSRGPRREALPLVTRVGRWEAESVVSTAPLPASSFRFRKEGDCRGRWSWVSRPRTYSRRRRSGLVLEPREPPRPLRPSFGARTGTRHLRRRRKRRGPTTPCPGPSVPVRLKLVHWKVLELSGDLSSGVGLGRAERPPQGDRNQEEKIKGHTGLGWLPSCERVREVRVDLNRSS